MPQRIPMHTVVVVRDKKRVVPPIGKVFDFTTDEIKSIESVNKSALRKPINESVDTSDTAASGKAAATKGAASKKPTTKKPADAADQGGDDDAGAEVGTGDEGGAGEGAGEGDDAI